MRLRRSLIFAARTYPHNYNYLELDITKTLQDIAVYPQSPHCDVPLCH